MMASRMAMTRAATTMPAIAPLERPLLVEVAMMVGPDVVPGACVADEVDDEVPVELDEVDVVEDDVLVVNSERSLASYSTVIGWPHMVICPETAVVVRSLSLTRAGTVVGELLPA